MNSKQRRQKLTNLIRSGNKTEACKFLWNTIYSIYCNQQYNHGRDATNLEWFRTLSDEKLEIIADEANYNQEVHHTVIRDARIALDERIDKQLGIVTES